MAFFLNILGHSNLRDLMFLVALSFAQRKEIIKAESPQSNQI